MRTGRPKAELTLSSDQRAHLLAITRSRSLPAALTLRAKIVLAWSASPAMPLWRRGLASAPIRSANGASASSPIGSKGSTTKCVAAGPAQSRMRLAELITKTLARKPKGATHWSVRTIAKETGIATVHRLFQLFGLQPHRTRSFKLSTDPFFVEKLRDVVGLYLKPPRITAGTVTSSQLVIMVAESRATDGG
jgi:putative transposase